MHKRNALKVLSKETNGWLSEVVGQVNANRVNARVMVDVEAEFHVHKESDEFFLVLNGEVEIDTEQATIVLTQGETYTVPANTKHRARVKGRAELLTVLAENA